MPYRTWLFVSAFGLIPLAVALWLSWVWFSSYQKGHAYERESAAQYEAETAQKRPDACRAIVNEKGLIDWLTCLADNISADGGVKRAEYDLKAQQDMAAWALGMLIVTVWISLITLAGVFFVWRTLNETATATKLLKQDYLAANPPIIKVFQAHLNFQEIYHPTGAAFGGVYTVNTGGSAATMINSNTPSGPRKFGNIVLHIGDHPPDRKPFDIAPFANPVTVTSSVLKSGDSFWWDIVDVSMVDASRVKAIADGEDGAKLFMIGRIHFLDTQDNWRQTVFCRTYDPRSGRFTRSDNPDYEYQA